MLFDAADPHPGHPDVVALPQAEHIGEHRGVADGAPGHVAAQRDVDQPGQRHRHDHEQRQPDQWRRGTSSGSSAHGDTVVPRATGPSSSWVATVAGLPGDDARVARVPAGCRPVRRCRRTTRARPRQASGGGPGRSAPPAPGRRQRRRRRRRRGGRTAPDWRCRVPAATGVIHGGSGGFGSARLGFGLISGGPTATRLPLAPDDGARRRRQIRGRLIVLRQQHVRQLGSGRHQRARCSSSAP